MWSSSESLKEAGNPLSRLLNSISSYDSNVMLAAVISLLLVILFVLLLHIYARWFLAQARHRRQSSMSVTHVLRPSRFHHFHTFTFETTSLSSSPSDGLELSIISSIPLFVYDSSEYKHGLDCVICLSAFEDNDFGRSLPKCGHGFHVECIDMWLQNHSNCPICRAPVIVSDTKKPSSSDSAETEVSSTENAEELILEVVPTDDHHVDELDGQSRLEIVTETTNPENVGATGSHESSALALSSSLGCSLMRMLSKNRSERKIFASFELDA